MDARGSLPAYDVEDVRGGNRCDHSSVRDMALACGRQRVCLGRLSAAKRRQFALTGVSVRVVLIGLRRSNLRVRRG
eukprot:scaffold8365_cov267-Pinguiococcus_pyrenoidosus.AAC.2